MKYNGEINEDTWYYIVRIGTNERFINRSGDINVCEEWCLDNILPQLNLYEINWMGIPISEYNRKFGNIGD